MNFNYIVPDLHQIDCIEFDILILSFFQEEKPVKGVAGLADWRLNGKINRLIKSGNLSGRFRESMLMPSSGRLPCRRLCVFGLGGAGEFNQPRIREASWFIMDTLRRLQTESWAMALPGSFMQGASFRMRAEILLEEYMRVFSADRQLPEARVFLIEPQNQHKELMDVVGYFSRRAKRLEK
ncbi:MAG: hypothetical protein FJ088_15985 [Deltaproteobacteria bacterium]|nr:hypothetical protein [Deltaproteobacteria bacterium]